MLLNKFYFFWDIVNTNPLTFFKIRHNMYDNDVDVIVEAFA